MASVQEQLHIAEHDRDAAQALLLQVQATTAQAVQDLTNARTAATASVIVTFVLLPSLASNALLNYKSGEGIKIYGKATAPLDVSFHGDSEALRLFLKKVQQRATQFRWTGILQVTQGTQSFNFIENYGQVSITSI
jgi:type II secretory pathway component PulL